MMTIQKKNTVRIKPKYVKNAQGKTIQVYLDMKSYESMINRITEFDAIKKCRKTIRKNISKTNNS